ncbi:hypothetical protein U9M48_000775 [Paspalum notatum var. saurae]|uniref:Uncharacterized protein n=1 Tax=Paspalum notatum var. saurae TaxID=547442 RepID=A0AAQ3SHM7_PASNO
MPPENKASLTSRLRILSPILSPHRCRPPPPRASGQAPAVRAFRRRPPRPSRTSAPAAQPRPGGPSRLCTPRRPVAASAPVRPAQRRPALQAAPAPPSRPRRPPCASTRLLPSATPHPAGHSAPTWPPCADLSAPGRPCRARPAAPTPHGSSRRQACRPSAPRIRPPHPPSGLAPTDCGRDMQLLHQVQYVLVLNTSAVSTESMLLLHSLSQSLTQAAGRILINLGLLTGIVSVSGALPSLQCSEGPL